MIQHYLNRRKLIRFLINYLIFTIVFFVILEFPMGFRDINEFFTLESVLALMEITFILFLYFFFCSKRLKLFSFATAKINHLLLNLYFLN